MFRFIHAADTHIDSPMEGLGAYEGAPVDALRGATRRAFEALIDLALEGAVDFLLIAGDLYDRDWKDFNTGLFFTGQMARLKAVGIPVYLVAGNHDAASVLTRRLSLPENVHAFSTHHAETLEVPGLPVAIHGRGFPDRSVPENLVPEYPDPMPGRFNIGLLHTSLSGAPGHDTYAPCSLKDLADKGYEYWALGHVHQPAVLAREPWVAFPGNLQGRHIRETGPRGCQVVVVNDSLEVEEAAHRALDVVRWDRVEVDTSGLNDVQGVLNRIRASLKKAVAGAEGRLLATRVTLTGASPLHGWFKRELPHLRAECIVQAQSVAGDRIWVEEVEAATTGLQDLVALAARDDLTRTVLEVLREDAASNLEIPGEVQAMLKALPAEIRKVVEEELSDEKRPVLVDDVRGILLESLARGGGGA